VLKAPSAAPGRDEPALGALVYMHEPIGVPAESKLGMIGSIPVSAATLMLVEVVAVPCL